MVTMMLRFLILCCMLAVTFGCIDKNWRCKRFPMSYCLKDKDYMKENCAKHCNLCPPPGPTCGVSKVAKGRVIGGKNAKAGAWPWQIGIFDSGKFACGGTLVNKRWIVTAAHCIEGKSRFNIRIKLGDLNQNVNEGEQILSLSVMITHPNYQKPRMVNNDIALLKLEKPAMLNNRVQPVCLPKKGEQPKLGSICFITGWGKIKPTGRGYPILQQLGLTIQSNTMCTHKNKKFYPITNQMICAANMKSKSSQSGCHGDSGGPFVCQQQDGSWKLHGVVSWGSPKCDSKDAFSVFANVGQYRDWIDKYIYNV